MNSKKFEYQHKDVPFLKRNLVIRTIFTLIFLGIFAWQMISLFLIQMEGSLSILQIVTSSFVMIMCLLLGFISLMYAFKYFRIMGAIKRRGKCVSTVQIIFSLKKTGFMKMYKILTELLTLLSVVILVCTATYSILSIAYYSTVSFYLPFLVALCLSGFSAVFQIDEEIKIVENVNQFNAIY